MKILMVCLGNICRSPLAEGILRSKIKAKGLDWTVDSAGTGGWHVDEAPHNLSQRIAKNHGVDISRLRGRQFQPSDLQDFDLIFVMDKQNFADVKYIAERNWQANKVFMILDLLHPGSHIDVPDPWFENTPNAFENVYQMLDKACDKIIENYSNSSL